MQFSSLDMQQAQIKVDLYWTTFSTTFVRRLQFLAFGVGDLLRAFCGLNMFTIRLALCNDRGTNFSAGSAAGSYKCISGS